MKVLNIFKFDRFTLIEDHTGMYLIFLLLLPCSKSSLFFNLTDKMLIIGKNICFLLILMSTVMKQNVKLFEKKFFMNVTLSFFESSCIYFTPLLFILICIQS